MVDSISPELRAKLGIIEAETDFFSQEPVKPRLSKLYVSLSVVILLGLGITALKSGEQGPLPALALLFGLNVVFYYQARQLYEMYSNACDIIKYYKSVCDSET